jgi:Mrp family chromosome partitioning ATPase
MLTEPIFVVNRMHHEFIHEHRQLFFVLGTNPGVGVTYCALRVAAAAAELRPNLSVLLVDMNLRDSDLSERAGKPENGWKPWLSMNYSGKFDGDLSPVVVAAERSSSRQTRGIPSSVATDVAEDNASSLYDAVCPWQGSERLRFLPVGSGPADRFDLAYALKCSNMFEILKKQYDFIIVDLPAFYGTSETRMICDSADCIMIVIEAEGTRRPIVKMMLEELSHSSETHVMGILYNKRKFYIPTRIYDMFF